MSFTVTVYCMVKNFGGKKVCVSETLAKKHYSGNMVKIRDCTILWYDASYDLDYSDHNCIQLINTHNPLQLGHHDSRQVPAIRR